MNTTPRAYPNQTTSLIGKSNPDFNQSGMAGTQCERVPSVVSTVDSLNKTAQMLREAWERHYGKIASVISQYPADPKQDNVCYPTEGCPLADRIKGIERNIMEIVSAIQETTNHVEL